jgi:hypothetical protein
MARTTNTSGRRDKTADVGVPRLVTTGLVFETAGSAPFSGRPLGDPRMTWVRRIGSFRPIGNRRGHS